MVCYILCQTLNAYNNFRIIISLYGLAMGVICAPIRHFGDPAIKVTALPALYGWIFSKMLLQYGGITFSSSRP